MRTAVIGILLFSGLAACQPAFSVADVHVSKVGPNDQELQFFPGGRFVARSTTMLDLIKTAYGVESDMIVGGPNWLDDKRYDVNAKAAPATDQAAMQTMLQNLLADRFKLTLHKDVKSISTFILSVSKRGLKLKESAEGSAADCNGEGGGVGKDIVIRCQHMTIAGLILTFRQNARAYVDKPVVDLTELKGTYDYTLSWTPKNQLKKTGSDADGPLGTSLFDAVEKQLGLTLALENKSVPVIVIDKVNDTPTPNAPEITSKLPKEPTEFEAADIRASAPGTKSKIDFLPGGRLDVKSVSMRTILSFSYGIDEDMVVGPKWLETEKFDIVAKAPRDVSQETMEKLMRGLLAERFKLKVHNEDQPVPVYALTMGKRGVKMKESAGEVRANCKPSAGGGKRNYTCQNTTMAQLADKLRGQAAGYITHPVVDLTGLKGAYDFVLTWTPKQLFQKASGATEVNAGAPGASDPNGDMTVFEAIDRQLGLKLEVQKYPQTVLVVDHADQKPTEN